MAKAYTRGAKRRVKKQALPGLAPTKPRKSRGRARMAEIKADPEAERTVLEARARQSGQFPKDLTEMRHTAYGEAAGCAIYAIHEG